MCLEMVFIWTPALEPGLLGSCSQANLLLAEAMLAGGGHPVMLSHPVQCKVESALRRCHHPHPHPHIYTCVCIYIHMHTHITRINRDSPIYKYNHVYVYMITGVSVYMIFDSNLHDDDMVYINIGIEPALQHQAASTAAQKVKPQLRSI